MLKKLCSIAIISAMIFAVSVAITGKAFAGTTAFSPVGGKSSAPATVGSERLLLAQKKRGGGGGSRGFGK